jgi:hypothetical protein
MVFPLMLKPGYKNFSTILLQATVRCGKSVQFQTVVAPDNQREHGRL